MIKFNERGYLDVSALEEGDRIAFVTRSGFKRLPSSIKPWEVVRVMKRDVVLKNGTDEKRLNRTRFEGDFYEIGSDSLEKIRSEIRFRSRVHLASSVVDVAFRTNEVDEELLQAIEAFAERRVKA